MITSIEFVKVCKAYQYDTIPNNVCTLNDRGDLKPAIFGENGRIYDIGVEGIPSGYYLYLFLDCEAQKEFYNTIRKVLQMERRNSNKKGFIDAIGTDTDGRTIVVIGIEE